MKNPDRHCVGMSPSLFYDYYGLEAYAAIRICLNCPVTDECLLYAIKHHELGVWGETTEREREKISLASRIQGVPVTLLRRNKLRVQARPVNVAPSSLSHISFPQKHTQEPVVKVAALQLVAFGIGCIAS